MPYEKDELCNEKCADNFAHEKSHCNNTPEKRVRPSYKRMRLIIAGTCKKFDTYDTHCARKTFFTNVPIQKLYKY